MTGQKDDGVVVFHAVKVGISAARKAVGHSSGIHGGRIVIEQMRIKIIRDNKGFFDQAFCLLFDRLVKVLIALKGGAVAGSFADKKSGGRVEAVV